uniref:Uncharacterized protein n=1 Tax=Arundo donax TaxID=35708 RepID=A0A0A9CIP0_ARUDO
MKWKLHSGDLSGRR